MLREVPSEILENGAHMRIKFGRRSTGFRPARDTTQPVFCARRMPGQCGVSRLGPRHATEFGKRFSTSPGGLEFGVAGTRNTAWMPSLPLLALDRDVGIVAWYSGSSAATGGGWVVELNVVHVGLKQIGGKCEATVMGGEGAEVRFDNGMGAAQLWDHLCLRRRGQDPTHPHAQLVYT